MANTPENSPAAVDAANKFNTTVDTLVMKNLAKAVDFSSLGVTGASEQASNAGPSVVNKVHER